MNVKLKFKLIAALLGLMIAIPGAVFAQNANDQVPDQDLQVAPAPSDQGSMKQSTAWEVRSQAHPSSISSRATI